MKTAAAPLFDLENLEGLVREPDLLGFEISPLNRYHGAASVFREYGGIGSSDPLAFGIEHYIPFDRSLPHQADFSVELPVYLATTRARARVYREHGMPEVHPAGFAYFYARENFRQCFGDDPIEERRGTVAFPHKSTVHRDRDFDRTLFIEKLRALPDECHPLTVCLYWRDVLRGNAEVYREAGFRTVTCGHYLHPDFLLRFHDLCRRHRFSCSNTIATSMPLSVLSGCRFFYLETGVLTVNSERFERDPFLDPPLARRALALSSRESEGMTASQVRFAERISGRRWVRSPSWIRDIHRQAIRRSISRQRPDERWSPPPVADHSAGLSKFLPMGVDWDGWAHPVGSLRFRGLQGTCAVVSLEVPSAGEVGIGEHSLGPGHHNLVLAIGDETSLTWKGKGIPLSEHDPRMRAFRVRGIEFSTRATPGMNPRPDPWITRVLRRIKK